jgi:hypothetical protein
MAVVLYVDAPYAISAQTAGGQRSDFASFGASLAG